MKSLRLFLLLALAGLSAACSTTKLPPPSHASATTGAPAVPPDAASSTQRSFLAPVRPWERGHLADYTMRPGRDPLTNSIAEHVWFTREAFAGGRGVGGGGCGCN
jgi:hypothetical protein